MADLTLYANTPLDGYSRNFGGISLEEIDNIAILSLAPALGEEEAFIQAVKDTLNLEVPKVGGASSDNNKSSHLLGLQDGQYFLINEGYEHWPDRKVKQQFGESVYITDQSDSWAVLKISGPRLHQALERICPLNLSEDTFPIGSTTRTVMEHLGVILYRLGPEEYWLLSAASSAGSFLHAVEVSCENVS